MATFSIASAIDRHQMVSMEVRRLRYRRHSAILDRKKVRFIRLPIYRLSVFGTNQLPNVVHTDSDIIPDHQKTPP